MTVRRRLGLIGVAALIGAIDTVVLKLFVGVVDKGTTGLWNDVFHTDEHRWVVVPLALVLGIALAGVLLLVRQPRLPPPHTNSLAFADDDEPATLTGIGMILFVGLICLLAGASLGPEAALVGSTAAFGLWCGQRTGDGPTARLLQLASVGALLVAFVGSFLLVLLPLLMLAQKKQLKAETAVPVVIASASAFGTLWLIDHGTKAYGSIPASSHFSVGDVLVAALVGALAAILGWALHQLIALLHSVALRLDSRVAWPVAAALFGAVIGLSYWAGGQSVEFSGNKGTPLLIEHQPAYALGALFVILVAKLLATSWSLASGYRGGLVFPSVFIGAAIALIAENVFSLTGPGVIIGAIAGMFSAMAGPLVAFIFIGSLIPIKLLGIAAVGIVGAMVGTRLCSKFPVYTPSQIPDA